MPRTHNINIVLIMTVIVLLAMATLLAFNINQLFNTKNEKYLAYNDVKGMAVVHKDKPYTLNFDQQKDVIEYLNRALSVGSGILTSNRSPLDFTKIIVYRFNKPDLIITPIQYEGENLIFSVPEWNHDGYLKDISYGHLKKLLSNTYDP